MRTANIERKTKETDISLFLDLDGTGEAAIQSGVGFLDHMLELFSFHSGIDIRLRCAGDTHVDAHHSVEDIGICLGRAIADALGDKAGIARYGSMMLPMDEALVLCALDFSGRAMLCLDVPMLTARVGTFDVELVEEFLLSLTRNLGCTLHLKLLTGSNTHHIIEACFKALGRAMKQAMAIDPALEGRQNSSKGTLS